MIAGAIYTLFAGQDMNWDWQNYHEYNVWAVLNGRYDIDVQPAGFQTYFNPLVYFPVYWLRHALPAPYGLAIMGAVHGLNLSLIYFFSRTVLGNSANALTLAASLLIALVGPMTLSEVGTSFSDILTALPIIFGFLLILSASDSGRARILLAGLLLGAAVGLKLTNVVYAAGAAAALLLAARPIAAIVCLAIGGAIGSAATGSFWSLMLWKDMGNPVFPLFNGIFQSRELQPVNILDLHFMPRSLLDALAYPFYWLVGDHRSSEFPFRDARFALVMILIPLALLGRAIKNRPIFTRRDVMFFVMFGVSYVAWLGMFSIQRYAVVLELLCGPLIVLVVVRLVSAFNKMPETSSRPAGMLAFAVAAAIALWSQPGDWWRRPWSQPYRPDTAALAQPATYFLLDKPFGYLAPLLAPSSRFNQLSDVASPVLPGGAFDRRIRAGLENPLPGGLWELHLRERAPRPGLLDAYGLAVDASRSCVEIEGPVKSSDAVACPLMANTVR
ncbi:MAG: glycosyltransferase 87 family protein [Xanthobacteraceae bacterium]|nr:glycosyltransferase 87 family protein [Xanthobacteraceae bacterium]